MKNTGLILIILTLLIQLDAQSITDKDYIISQTKVELLEKMSEDHKEIQKKYRQLDVPKVVIDRNNQETYFSHFDKNGKPVYYELSNESSAISSKIHEIRTGGDAGLDLDGTGLNIGLWDGGNPRVSHRELAGKIIISDTTTAIAHASHVAGILVASGITREARGMASGATIESFTSQNWLSEIPIWAAEGGMITNHSYIIANPKEEYELYGIYNVHSQNWDAISYAAPYLIMCTGASNNGNSNYNPDGSRYDLLASNKIGKNAIVVGACEDVLNYTGPSAVRQATFTSWGPTDDWRIKPDLAAVGTNSYSTREASDIDYGFGNGSSYAGPIVAGGLALLQQHYHNRYDAYMKATTAKALILSTADEAGAFDGPDFANGWGLFNARKAADVITNAGISAELLELSLDEGEIYSKRINLDGTEPLSVAINWNDPPSQPHGSGIHNDPTLMLINDLDLRLVSESDTTTYYPWRMEPNADYNNYTAPAEKGDNYRDNTEIIFEDELPAGFYTVIVTHKNNLEAGSQDFSLVINGIDLGFTASEDTESTSALVNVYPNPVDDILHIDLTQTASSGKLSVSVYDMSGQMQLAKSFLAQTALKLDVSDLISGTYNIQIHDSSKQLIAVKKVVIE